MLCEEFSCVAESVSCTTRLPRVGEVEGKHYHFLTKEAFDAKIRSGERMTRTGMVLGTREYMAPEQLLRIRSDKRSDLFALGTVLFYLVSGHLPFTGGNPSLILKNVIEGACILADGPELGAKDLENASPQIPGSVPGGGTDWFAFQTLEQFRDATEKEFIRRKLVENGGNVNALVIALNR